MNIADVSPPDKPLQLRPYQREALEAIAHAETRGIRRPLVALPTGTGKTPLFTELIRRRGGRALVLAHRDELLHQAVDKLLMADPTAQVGLVKGEVDDHEAPTVVASIQTLGRSNRLQRLIPDFTTVVVDEAHHSIAATYQAVLAHCRAFEPDGPLTLGVTATPERSDGEPLRQVWQEIVYRKSILEMILAGYLVDLRAMQVRLDADFHTLHTQAGDFIDSEAAALLSRANAPTHAVQAYREYADGRKALLFTPTVALAFEMVEAFEAEGIPTEALDGTTPPQERRAILRRLQTGETMVVCNCGVLTEGFDEPSVDCIIVARPTRSKLLYIQMIGRGTRLFPGKRDLLILDLVGATSRHDLMTAATLFEMKPSALAKHTLSEAVEAGDREAPAAQTLPDGRLVGISVDLFHRRPLHWLRLNPTSYMLPLGGGWVSLAAQGDRWHVDAVRPDGQRVGLASNLDLSYAQGIAEDYARNVGAGGLANPNARWRQEPATDKQRYKLAWLRIPVRPGLTKGEAFDLIAVAEAGRKAAHAS